MTNLTVIDQLSNAIDERALKLYSEDEWQKQDAIYQERGINFELNCMLEETLSDLFGSNPDLFQGSNWLNDDNGLPLWVRPGVEWVPDNELDDDED
jgi:hypothetical protein